MPAAVRAGVRSESEENDAAKTIGRLKMRPPPPVMI